MDSTDEEFYGSTSFTTKGRRTKRQRTVTATTTTTTSSYGGCIEISYGSSASATPSPSTPDDHDIISQQTMTTTTTTTTTEEEDMANCLILLAQGVIKKTRSSKPKYNINNTNNSTTGSNAVIGVYECKTCNRTFPSFQALGGHRTSHKKITSTTTTTVTPKPPKLEFSQTPSPKETPEKNTANRNNNNSEKSSSSTRVHECSICGSEFTSGQALGGHMRRHRPVVTPSSNATIVNGDGPISEVGQDELGGSRNILSLDLNLPAPNEHEEVVVVVDGSSNTSSHMVETKFHVIPTPALLDCHY